MENSEDDDKAMIVWGRDEMNLVELPFGPITPSSGKTLEVVHPVHDTVLNRKVTRKTIITGSDAFGLPKPIDDLVLVGMMALTKESGFQSARVEFSVYHLCRVVGWAIDGKSYRRVENSLNRIAGTTLVFKDAWYDKGEKEFKSKAFHLIDEVDLRSRDQIDRSRKRGTGREARLSSIVWNQVIWKSFQDGFIRRLDMRMFRRIAKGRRRDVPIRLFRILDKRFYRTTTARFGVEQLAVGVLGLSPRYAPSQMRRIIDRAAKRLIECGYLAEFQYCRLHGSEMGGVVFRKQVKRLPSRARRSSDPRRKHRLKQGTKQRDEDEDRRWFANRSESELRSLEEQALEARYGSELERKLVRESRAAGEDFASCGLLRRQYVRRFAESTNESDKRVSSTSQKPE